MQLEGTSEGSGSAAWIPSLHRLDGIVMDCQVASVGFRMQHDDHHTGFVPRGLVWGLENWFSPRPLRLWRISLGVAAAAASRATNPRSLS